MPVPVREKLRAVTRDLGSQARVAEVLGVSRSRVSRWLRTEAPDPENRRKVEGLEFVLARLLQLYTPQNAVMWLLGSNPFLRNWRPIDRIAQGRITEVLGAVDAEQGLSYA
jgi:hypothetical protein